MKLIAIASLLSSLATAVVAAVAREAKLLSYIEIKPTSTSFEYVSKAGNEISFFDDTLGLQSYLKVLHDELGAFSNDDMAKCFGPGPLYRHQLRPHEDMIDKNGEKWDMPSSRMRSLTRSNDCHDLLKEKFSHENGKSCGFNAAKRECIDPSSEILVISKLISPKFFDYNVVQLKDLRDAAVMVCDDMDGDTSHSPSEGLDEYDLKSQAIISRPMFCADLSMHIVMLESIGVNDNQNIRFIMT